MQENNFFTQIVQFIEKITEIVGMSDEEKQTFSDKLILGFLQNILNESQDIISPENLSQMNELSLNLNPENASKLKSLLESALSEIANSEKGQQLIIKNLEIMLDVVMRPLNKSLSREQVSELKNIFS